MAFFHQLRLLLWKNGLGVIRQPVWSLTLITWPLVIFIILAITRQQFPPKIKEACYVGPRNLPSTGFFPFLQTLMCNTDSTCHNKSRQLTPHASRISHGPWDRRSSRGSPLAGLIQGGVSVLSALGNNSKEDSAKVLELWGQIFSSTQQGKPNNIALMNAINSTLLGDQEPLTAMLESVNVVKKSICTFALPLINTSSANPLTFALITFCKSNDTVLEVSLLTFNKVLNELLLNNTSEMVTVAGMVALVYDQLQNQSSLWESFLAIPQLFSPSSLDQALSNAEALLTSIQGAMHVIQKSFPEAGASISMVQPLLARGINLGRYVKKWPGRDVTISLGDVILQNESLSEVVKRVLQEVRIPLDKAIGLTLDRDTVRSYMCDNSSNPVWLTAACATGTVDMLLGWISPRMVANQVLLAWSKHVASHDVAFAKGVLHSLMGGSGPGGQGGSNNIRARRSVDSQPQNIEEELFLEVGRVVLEILKSFPEVDMVIQRVLSTGFTSMRTGNQALDTVEEMMQNVLEDAAQLQKTFLTLMTNQSEASIWIGRVLDSVAEMIIKSLTIKPLTCEGLLSPFEWLLSTKSVNIEVWRTIICQNRSALQETLLMDWLPLVQKVQEINSTLLGQADYNVTLPMILSEWHKLSNNTLQFGVFLDRLAKELGADYWMDWMPKNNTYDVTGTLQQSVFLALVSFGEKTEKSQLWPQVKNYFHMVYWIMNYKPGVTTEPANCSADVNTLAVRCDTGLNWPRFVQATAQALMSLPNNQEVLVNCLKGTVNLLQHVYGGIYKHQAGLYLQQAIPGGNMLSAYLINLMNNLDGFAQKISTLNDIDISNPNRMLPLINNLLQSMGLTPLLPLLYSNTTLNISTVLGAVVKFGRFNQHIFTFNETDPALPDLERLIIKFLSMEGNLTLPLSFSMGHTLLTYSGYLNPDDVARLREAIQPFTNQTSAGAVEAMLSAMELLKKMIDAPNGNPTNIILGYIHQLQEFLVSALRLRKIEQLTLPSGQLSTAQVTDLYLVAMDLLKLVTPEGLQNLTQAGPDAAQKVVIGKMLALLPSEVQQQALSLLRDFQVLQNQMSLCTTGQNCVAGVSELFMFLDQILEMMLAAKGNITITLATKNLWTQEYEQMTTTLFSLLRSPKDAAYVRIFNQTLYFIRLVMARPIVTVSDVQNALRQSNLTLEELNRITALAGAANIGDLMINIMEIINVHQCFEPQHAPFMTVQCAMGLIHGVSGFLTQLPALRNETVIISLIPVLVNKTFTDAVHVNFSSNPHQPTIEILNSTLTNIKMSLQRMNLNSPEIMNEIRVLEGLLKLAANTEPFNGILNSTLLADAQYAQKVYFEIAQWYLKKLENVTSNSSVSELLYPFYRLTEMQVAIQLAQADFSLFVRNQVEYLLKNLQYPINGAEVSKIGQTTIKILRHQFEFIKTNLEIQNDYFQSLGMEPVFNTTILYATERQFGQYFDLLRDWIKHPNVTSVLTSMLQWGNSSMNVSTPGADLHRLLQTMGHFLNDEQLAYLSIIDNITQALNKALMVAGQPGGLQSDHFSGAILEAVQSVIQSLTAVTGPLPLSVHQHILGIVRDSLQLIVKPEMSFASSRNISLLILKRAESIIQQTVPKMLADYLLFGIQIATTYFETMSLPGGPDKWNEIILNEMKTVQSLLPPNSTAHAYISVFINITRFILESGQGNMSLWARFESASAGDLSVIIREMGKLINTLLPLVMGDPSLPTTIPSLESFTDLAPLLEQVMTGKANQDTWNKLGKMLEALLSTLNGTQSWDNIPLVTSLLEKVIGAVINNMQAENGNMSLWARFESASGGNLSVIISEMGKLINTLLPLVMGDPSLQITIPSLESFTDLAPVLEQVMTGKANQDTWNKLGKMLEALLSTLNGTQLWDNIPLVTSLLEKVIGAVVNNMQAENVMILSLQRPIMSLIAELSLSVNTSRFNLSDASERMQLAIELTVEAAKKANGTLECSEALKPWEPVREAAGLSEATLGMWCKISLQPVMEAHAAAQIVYANLHMNHTWVGPVTVSTTAARIVEAVQSFYQVNINRTLVTGKLIEVFSSQLSNLAGQPLSPEAELQLYKQFQDMQLRQSLANIKMLSDQLLNVAPSLQAYIQSLDRALSHILNNYELIQNGNSAEDLFREAAIIFLTSMNITSDSIPFLWNFSGLNEMSLINMMKEAVKLIIRMKVFGDAPMVYQAMEQFVTSNNTRVIVEKVVELFTWWNSTQASGMDLVTQALPRIYDTFRAFLSLLTQMSLDLPANMELFEDLVGHIIAMLRQMVSTSDLLAPMDYYLSQLQGQITQHNPGKNVRRRREAIMKPMREPMDDFIDLFYIDYHGLFKAVLVQPTTEEILETAHVFFTNPDLGVVMKGVTANMSWGLNASKEETIDATLGVLSYLTLPSLFQMSSMDLLWNAIDMLPEGFPFSVVKKITQGLASESQENLILMQQTIQTGSELLNTSLTDPRFAAVLGHLTAQVCALEKTVSVRQLMQALSMEPGLLCDTLLPSLQILAKSLLTNTSELSNTLFQTFIGDPSTYDIQANWASVLTESLGFDASSLKTLNINVTTPGPVVVGQMMRNKTAFVMDVHRHMDIDPYALNLLMNTTLPNNNLVILSWLVNLTHCKNPASLTMNQTEAVIFRTFCSMSTQQWYIFSLLMAQHLDVQKFIYRVVLPEDMQRLVELMIQMAKFLIDMMGKLVPTISRLESYLLSMDDLNLVANPDFHNMMRGQKARMSSKATFVTLSRALCKNGILALFGLSKLPTSSESDPSSPSVHQKEEMIEKFKIPRNASPFCMNMYLDMVNTTGGAIAWAFLKPMLMGHILYTPDTPITRALMEKSNSTLQEFANLKTYSEDWIESSNTIIDYAKILSNTLPLLQNSLGNSFVKNFIEMQTDINVGNMKETLSNFSNMTVMLEKNKHILKQITTVSNLMVNMSSCIKFDRFRGYDSADELNTVAQDLAKNRDLYASVIFKLPKDEGSSKKRHNTSSSYSESSLPPKVSYTIRMHMDNVMRTDRIRNPLFVKESYISARQSLRYNRGFVYLQENIDRAIIETHTGQKVTEPAVQLQPFPYPCYFRDEYLEAISFVFPLMLMIAWVLFVADFVKKLVHERELRLHEYMKMMGVNPLSHFFAWFLECSVYLVFTVIILTLVLKYGLILPNSNGFVLFLYFCDYSLSILAISYLVSSFFDKTYIAGLSGSLIYMLCFFPFIVVLGLESTLTFSQKSVLSLFSPTCFSYASQYISRYETQGEGIQWSNMYISPMARDTGSFGWLCWLMLIDSILYFIIGAYIRMVFPGKYGIPAPWYFPVNPSFWADLCGCCSKVSIKGRGLTFFNIMQKNQPVFPDDKGKGQNTLSSQDNEELPLGVVLHGLTKLYGDRAAIENLNVSFYEGHVTSLLGHNGAGKTTTMSLLTGLFAPTSGTIEVYGRDMQANIDSIRKELGVCMQYDVHFDHMTAKEHLLLYGQIKAPHWSRRELHEQVRKILEETGMYAHRHKRVGTLSGGMKRKLSISIAFIGGSRLVVLDEPTTGVDPCSRRSIWDIVIKHKRGRTIIMSTHHLDEAEVLSDRIAFLERGGLNCCGSPFHLKDKLGQGYKLTLTKKMESEDSGEKFDSGELKTFIQAHVPEARLKEAQVGDLVYSLPPFTSSNASSYRSLLTALDANLDALQLGCYGISDTTLEEVFLHLTQGNTDSEDRLSVAETVSDTGSIDSLPEDLNGSSFGDNINLTGSSTVCGLALVWQQITAVLVKRFHHSRRDWKGLISQVLLPVLFVTFAMGLGSIKNDLQHYPEMDLSPALYNIGPSYSFFSDQKQNSSRLADTMMSFPGIDNACVEPDQPDHPVCARSTDNWNSRGNSSRPFSACKCAHREQVCTEDNYHPPHKKIPSSQTVYNLTGINVENYLLATANDFIRNRYGGFVFGKPLPPDLLMDLTEVPKTRTLSKVWYNPEGHHTMPAYLNSLNNLILRSSIPADKDPRKYAISVSSHPYFGRADDEDAVVQGMIQILVALCVLTGYAITTASFAIYEVHEHHSGSKRLQHIAGISEPFYWTVNFFYDMMIYLVPVTLTVGVIAAFQIPAFTDRQNLAAVTLLLVLFGFSTFPWMYLLSSVFKDAEMAFITYVCINLFVSVNTILSTSIVYFLGQIAMHNNEAIQEIFRKLSHAFLIFPQFSFGNGLMQLARVNMEVQLLSGYGIDAYRDPFSMDELGWMFLSSFLQGLFFFTLRLLLNKWLIRKVRRLILARKVVPQMASGDEDVVAEHLRVSSGAASSDVLQVNQLTKVYQHLKKKVHAVKGLSVGIPAGECFGLLGVNGAGKTTTFKMLTGDVCPTDGTAQIKDWDGRLVDIMECRNEGINIGYCPQVDALDDLLSGEEHLYFYARIRGISKREIDGVVNYLLNKLELGYYRNNVTDGYSCGTRRKLSTALALIGHPQILLLDEPSSGMDPRSKRHLWKIISDEVKGKCAVVLTSHSMEECEALCGRLAIMVKGQFRCLGSLQHIKNRFGSGFTVKMYLARASCDVEAITGFMQQRFPSTYLKDQQSTMVEYHVPVAPGGVADIFDQLESNKTALQIQHFSVSQTTLDEVFINFAMGKIGEETPPDIPIDDEGDCDSLDSIEAVKS